MKRRFWLSVGAVALAVLGLVTAACRNPMSAVDVAAQDRGAGKPPAVVGAPGDLVAGRTIPVGKMVVTNDPTHLVVTYTFAGPWRMTESHLAVAATVNGIPQTKSHNPIPGQFPLSARHAPPVVEYSYSVDLAALNVPAGQPVVIAAHAEVERVEGGVVVQRESAWAAGTQFEGANWATYFTYTPVLGYGVTYDANGATTGSIPVDSTRYDPGALVTVLENTGGLAREGFVFSGWNSAANGGGTSYAPGASFVMGNEDVRLYAQWSGAVPGFSGYWDMMITLGAQHMDPIEICIDQDGAHVELILGPFPFSGMVEGASFTVEGEVQMQPGAPWETVTIVGSRAGTTLVGTLESPGMGEGTFVATPSQRHFGHLTVAGSCHGTEISLDTEFALLTRQEVVTTQTISFSLQLGGRQADVRFTCSELAAATEYQVQQEEPQNEPGLMTVWIWQEGVDHWATGGTVRLGTFDGAAAQGTFVLEFQDGLGTLSGGFNLQFAGLGSAWLDGEPPSPTWSTTGTNTRTPFQFVFFDTRRSLFLWLAVNDALVPGTYTMPHEAWLDVQYVVYGEEPLIAMDTSGGYLRVLTLSDIAMTGDYSVDFAAGGTLSGAFSLQF
jgi:uncharacterized repeat protein (TIGR02543 family)